jgi:hypothetical protein
MNSALRGWRNEFRAPDGGFDGEAEREQGRIDGLKESQRGIGAQSVRGGGEGVVAVVANVYGLGRAA